MSINFYNNNADIFFNQTVNEDMSSIYKIFIENLPNKNGSILDLGCGSGRDSKYFLKNGFEVLPLDLSSELSVKASEYIGQEVIIKDMRDIDYSDKFIGVWACASILHIKQDEIENLFFKIFNSLKKDGIFYSSFKYGEKNYEKEGRNFTCFTEKKFFSLFPTLKEKTIKIFITNDVRKGRENEKWFNIILKK